jgi:hypothetical protein
MMKKCLFYSDVFQVKAKQKALHEAEGAKAEEAEERALENAKQAIEPKARVLQEKMEEYQLAQEQELIEQQEVRIYQDENEALLKRQGQEPKSLLSKKMSWQGLSKRKTGTRKRKLEQQIDTALLLGWPKTTK